MTKFIVARRRRRRWSATTSRTDSGGTLHRTSPSTLQLLLCDSLIPNTIAVFAFGVVIFLLCIQIDQRPIGISSAIYSQIAAQQTIEDIETRFTSSLPTSLQNTEKPPLSLSESNNHHVENDNFFEHLHFDYVPEVSVEQTDAVQALLGTSVATAIRETFAVFSRTTTPTAISGIILGVGVSLSAASITFTSAFSEKCAIFSRFSLGILILTLIQAPLSVDSLASVTGIKLRSEIASQSRRRITDNTTYNAILDGEILLPCNITAPSLDDSASLVLWYRDDIASPIYTVDARSSTTLEAGRHFPESDLFGTRATFNLSYPLSFLRIRPVKATDSGDYRCRVDFRRARTVNRILKLTVIVPSTEVKIYDSNLKQIVGQTAGPFDEGTNVVLICDSDKGVPLPAVHWWRSLQQLSSDYIVVNNTIARNILTLRNVSRDDLLSTLTCRAHNTNLTVPVTRSITLDLNLRPREIRIITPAENITAGETSTIELACQCSGSKPAAKIFWFRGDETLTPITESVSADGVTTTSFVSFTPSIEYNGKKVVCRGENPAMSSSTVGAAIEDKWLVNIYYPPILALIMGSDSQSGDIVEGANVYFECDVKANPQVSNIQWRLNGQLLLLPTSSNGTSSLGAQPADDIEIRNGTLRIGNVNDRHFGQYQCSASNSLDTSESDSVFLNVKYAPRCLNRTDDTPIPLIGVAIGEQITIECEVHANPADVMFEWTFNQTSSRSVNALKFTDTGTRSIAKFAPIHDNDFGTLLCTSRNVIGTQKTPCAYDLVKAEPPSSPHNCTIANKTSNSLTLECLPGHSGGLEQRYHLQAYTMNPNKLLKTVESLDWPRFSLQNLPSGFVFKLVIFASNRLGRSRAIEITGSTTEPSPWKSAEYGAVDVGPALSVSPILIVSLLAMLLLGTIIVLFVKIRIKLKHRSNEKVHVAGGVGSGGGSGCGIHNGDHLSSFVPAVTSSSSTQPTSNNFSSTPRRFANGATPLKSIMKNRKSSHENLLELSSYVELHSTDSSLLPSTNCIEFCSDGHLMESYGQASDNDALVGATYQHSQPQHHHHHQTSSIDGSNSSSNLCTVNVLTLPYYVPSLDVDFATPDTTSTTNTTVTTGSSSSHHQSQNSQTSHYLPLTLHHHHTAHHHHLQQPQMQQQQQQQQHTHLVQASATVENTPTLQTFTPFSHHDSQNQHHTLGEHPTELPILNIVNTTHLNSE